MSEKSRGTFLVVQNLFVTSVILYFFCFLRFFFFGRCFSMWGLWGVLSGSSCTSLPKMTHDSGGNLLMLYKIKKTVKYILGTKYHKIVKLQISLIGRCLTQQEQPWPQSPSLKMRKKFTLSDITYVCNLYFSGDYLLVLIDNSDLKFLRIFQRTKFILEKWINWNRTSLKDRKCRQEIGHNFVTVCS